MVQLVEVCRLSEHFFRGEYLSKYFTSDEKCYCVAVQRPSLMVLFTLNIRNILVRLSATKTACIRDESQKNISWRIIVRGVESWNVTAIRVLPH